MKPNKLLPSAFVTLLLLLAYSGLAPAALVVHGKDPIDTVGTPEGPSTGTVVSWTYGVGTDRARRITPRR